MSGGSRLLLIGLRGSGKTSYLAAFWHVIEAGELPSALAVAQLQGDREYLNRIRDHWLKFEEVGRTSLRSQEIVSLVLQDVRSKSDIHVTVPDLSGELFRLQWATRKATRQYVEYASEAVGVLLFIHPNAIVESHVLLPDEKDACDVPVTDSSDSGLAGNLKTSTSGAVPWSPDLSPTQVQLVELLQFVSHLRSSPEPPPIAVIVSAWDTVKDPVLPISWLENKLPLLSQFLTANVNKVPFQVYGVSALGGDLEKDRERLQHEDVPSHRIKVVQDTFKPHGDLTAPIQFLLAARRSMKRTAGQ